MVFDDLTIKKFVLIGHAVGDENGEASGGEAGDQTGKEVKTQNWYLNKKGWIVLRPKSSEVAFKLAEDMLSACSNDNIGYDQHERNTLFNAARIVGYDCSKVTKKCECDCSSLVRVCCYYAGIKVKTFNTATEVDTLMATGKFDKLTDPMYTEKSDYLKVGDILVTKTKGHTAIVLTNGSEVNPQPEPTPTPTPTAEGYVLVLGSVNVRDVPRSTKPSVVIFVAHKGDKLPYLGKSEFDARGNEWYYVETEKGKGWISAFTNAQRKYTLLITTA